MAITKTSTTVTLTLFVVVALAALLMVGVAPAFAAAPAPVNSGDYFLCPAVGAGVLNSPQLGAGPLPAPGYYTFIPGNNQAGAHVNPNGTNQNGLPSTTNVPGNGNSNWSPIWNATI